MQNERIPLEVRFWRKVRKGPGCWEWTGHRNEKGYGLIRVGGKDEGSLYAHRVSYELAKGPLGEGMCALHTCDNPPCVRPDHLFAGTQRDNIDDMVAKGRSTRGERHPQAKLSLAEVEEVRRRYVAGGVYQDDLGAAFGISQSQVSEIVRGISWGGTPLPTDGLLTPAEFAQRCGVTRRTVDRWLARDQIPAVRRGWRILIPETAGRPYPKREAA